jgi:hypothetical protein
MILMSKNLDKQARQIQDSIGRVLFEDWDPIGVRGFGPEDEYDSYVGGIYRLLCSSPTEAQVVEHLREIEAGWVKSSPQRLAQLEPVARKLMSLNVKLHQKAK